MLGAEDLGWCGLLGGEQAHELALTAAYLIRLDLNHSLTDWLLNEGWGKGWGFYFLASQTRLNQLYPPRSQEKLADQVQRGAFVAADRIEASEQQDLVQLRRHFRRYTQVEWQSDGRVVRFRFFDPAVLRVWLLSCNQTELNAFMGPIPHMIAENWCEAPLLSSKQHAWHFYKPNDAAALQTRKTNMVTRKSRKVDPYEASKAELTERPRGPLNIIRTEQLGVFEDVQIQMFAAEVAEDLAVEIAEKQGGKPLMPGVLKFVNEQFKRAADYGLETQYDLNGFTFCAYRLGKDFDQREDFRLALNSSDTNLAEEIFYDYIYAQESG